jgi:hypothetical protein
MLRRSPGLLALTLALQLLAACGVQSSNDSSGATGPTPNPYVPDASDAGEPVDAPSDTVVAQAFKGSPLCSVSSSTCDPDEPTTAAACRYDAGASSSTPGAALMGCHVQGGDASAAQLACLPAGLHLDGYACTRASDCLPTYECTGDGTCRHYCCEGNAHCPRSPQDEFCDIQPLAADPTTLVPVCVATRTCTLLDATGCASSETCAVVREDGTTSCVAVGLANAGDECDDTHCGRNLVCLGGAGERRCSALCHTGSSDECTAPQVCKGGLPLFPDPTIGICQ